jgi:hypothetical protein
MTDLLGDNTEKSQALANEIARRDFKRNNGQDFMETGDPTDMFSLARLQIDLVDVLETEFSKLGTVSVKSNPDVVLVEVSPTMKPKQATLAVDSGLNIKQFGTGVAAKLVVIDKEE